MAGIYIHVPFCKTRCIYCDFYSSTNEQLREAYVHALCQELTERVGYLQGEPIETIYFGGGTPSQLSIKEIEQILQTIASIYNKGSWKEVTLEANPDDLSDTFLEALSHTAINRLSIGIQTFDDNLLKLLNRRHNSIQAIEAISRAKQYGFHNISIDLIYGLPGETLEVWEHDLTQAIALNPNHISAYHLTYEEGTAIHALLRKKQIAEVSEANSLQFFQTLITKLTAAGYEHYEISNFAKPEQHSRHNSAYWSGTKYLGCGPSAHSFDGESREWNTADIALYIKGIEAGKRPFEKEILNIENRYNELIITSLRTNKGVSLKQLEIQFGDEFLQHCLKAAQPFINREELCHVDDYLRLTPKGIFISDGIMGELLRV
ncbi:radical SAM family heme chaperone HemW [Bacteroides sp. 214]|uniref:radical SAM family heme chaperone HemW n=1 Tax=Bacteroides sp. 214 TaxID=2302935 RepID=UPI0013D76923|nr:radical SAM family heme chaperone HemW [Bacteroides sp. 214]NDW11708.1 radical SAM family heme chaperone HemW [Bacteroides sp. 214]